MNYLWNAIQKSRKNDKEIFFEFSKNTAFPFELVNEIINNINLDKSVKVNYQKRLNKIFNYFVELYSNNLLDKEIENSDSTLKEITNLLLHFIGNFDLYKGLTKEEIVYSYIEDNFKTIFGPNLDIVFSNLTTKEKRILSKLIFKSYITKDNFFCFRKAIDKIFAINYLYKKNNMENAYIIYVSNKKNKTNCEKLEIIKALFFDIRSELEVFWEYHFGIIGVKETMKINNIKIY